MDNPLLTLYPHPFFGLCKVKKNKKSWSISILVPEILGGNLGFQPDSYNNIYTAKCTYE